MSHMMHIGLTRRFAYQWTNEMLMLFMFKIQKIIWKKTEAKNDMGCQKAIKCLGQYLKAKKVAEQKFLARKQCKHTDSTISQYPDIRKIIEDFVEQQNIGADAWRTGVLTFDGNTSVGKTITFKHIVQHLQQVYK